MMSSSLHVAGATALAAIVANMAPALGSEPAASAWQDVISQQLQAFHDRDSDMAVHLSVAAVHASFGDPRQFIVALAHSGYAPLLDSRSHTFGLFSHRPDGSVLQEVKLVGGDQMIYEAIYSMRLEDGTWRVSEVGRLEKLGVAV
jgi:hypothetical protein